MGSITGLNKADYMALARAMDTNGNHKIDAQEANFGSNTHNKIGNQNGVVGTREFANALENGDVFMKGMGEATANKFAEYFSKRNENFDRPVAEWISDAWVSKSDFTFSDANKRVADVNGDNKVSRKELAAALMSGHLAVGESRQVSRDPFSQPSQPATGRDPFNNDPFQRPSQPATGRNPFNDDPFSRPQQPAVGRDPFNNDPFDQPSRPRHTEVSLKLRMLDSMSSSFEKGQLLGQLVRERELSPQDQVMLVDATMKHIGDDFTQHNLLSKLAGRSDLHQEGAVKIMKAARELNSFNAGQVLDKVLNSQELSPRAQRSAIITASTLGDDFSKSQAFTKIIRTQNLGHDAKAFLMDTVSQHISSDFTKRQIMDQLF